MSITVERLGKLIGNEIEKKLTNHLTEYQNKLFEKLNKPLPNKLLGGSEKPKQKLHNFDDYELRDNGGFDTFGDFLKAVKEKNYTALENCRPTEKDMLAGQAPGDMIIPSMFQARIIDSMQEQEICRPLCVNYTLKRGQGETLTVPAIESYDFSSDVAGINVYWKGEEATYTESTPTLRQVALKLNKLTAKTDLSEELIFSSAINTGDLIAKLFGNAAAFEIDNVIISGTGGGQPLGFTNGNDLITVDGEVGQTGDTLVFENIGNMVRRLMPGAWNSAVWLCNIGNITQLLTLAYKLGTAAIPVKCFNEANGTYTLLGRPVRWSQHTGALGEANSIMLCNFKRYITLSRDNMMIRSDEGKSGTNWEKDIVSFKLTMYLDGQPADSSVTTLKDGVNTVSNFVTINAI